MQPTKCFWILFTLSLISSINSQLPTETPEPTPNPTPNPTKQQNTIKPCCQCTVDKTSPLQPHPPSGCPQDPSCQEEICSIQSSCCSSNNPNEGWNQICANIAMIPCISNPGTCCKCTTATPRTPGCMADIQCQNQICDINSDMATCCTNEWNPSCALLANSICNLNSAVTIATLSPSQNPTTTTPMPTPNPTPYPTKRPTSDPTIITGDPTGKPTGNPTTETDVPSIAPITAKPSFRPSVSPTNKPTKGPTELYVPSVCDGRCDAFSVRVMDYELCEHNVSITYRVQRLFSDGLCKKSVKYLVLGLCDSFLSELCSDSDVNGLINHFEVIHGNRRILDADSASSDSAETILETEEEDAYRTVWGSNSDGEMTGIRINLGVEKELEFKINLRNVFMDTSELIFSNQVRFSRGKREFNCVADFLQGLPCLDENKFIIGGYSDTGYNMMTKKFDIDSKFINGGQEYEKAMVIEKNSNDNSWGVLSELDPYIRYSLISIAVTFVLFMVICALYVCNKRKLNMNRFNSNDSIDLDVGNEMEDKKVDMEMDDDEMDIFSITGNVEEELEDHSLVRFTSN